MTSALLTEKDVRAIAKVYDGTTETIDTLVKRYGVQRHNIVNAAKRGGYKTRRSKISWTDEKDQYLRDNWGKLPPAEIYAHLKCSPASVFNRLKRIGHSTRHNTDFTIYDVEHLLKLDHRIWRRFIDDGWLKSYPEYGRNGAVWSRRIKLEQLHAFLREHPEIINYRDAPKYSRAVLELDKLPDPPKYVRLTCRADNWKDGVKPTPVGRKIHHGEVTLEDRMHEHSLDSCEVVGGTDFWAPVYVSNPNCPRCGCLASRFSEKALYTDDAPDEGDALNAIAGKLGLTWRDGRFWTAKGKPVTEEELLKFVFSTKRNAGKAFSTFRRLLQAGMTVAPPNPVAASRVLPNILDYKLRDGQQAVFDAFLESGNIGVYWPPGIGKMYLLGQIYTRVAGEHFLFVHTTTIREQWIEFFKAHAPRVKVAGYYKDTTAGRSQKYHRVDIYDRAGELRSVVRIYSYVTRASFGEERPVVVGFDESQFLPGNNASRLAMIKSEFRVGLSATPFREDGRGDLIQVMTGNSLGEDWQEFRDNGQMPDVPVRVVIVQDLEQKYRALERALRGRRTIVFSDAIEDGMRIEREAGIPFIHAMTKNRLKVLAENKTVCMSRVGDCGLDVQDLEEVIEFNFHHGSRAQSLQRLGRLLHSRKPLRHTVLMTVKEFSLYHKRLTALEQKGFRISIVMFKDMRRRGRPLAPKPVSVWAQLLGAKRAIPTGTPLETTAAKRKRVLRRIEERESASREAVAA